MCNPADRDITVRVVMPRRLDSAQRKAIQSLAEVLPAPAADTMVGYWQMESTNGTQYLGAAIREAVLHHAIDDLDGKGVEAIVDRA